MSPRWQPPGPDPLDGRLTYHVDMIDVTSMGSPYRTQIPASKGWELDGRPIRDGQAEELMKTGLMAVPRYP